MSYQALYRKYRPSTLEDVIGQDIIIQILKNAIKNDKVCHAYMFSGPRGIGKTSIAKLLAKTVNCLDLQDGDACGKCENCLSINNGFNSDIIEIDAASNNGVDEIREIKNKINLVPNQLKYKVYIIDEVHMLSIGAFNALLKTIEEPPKHVIFILATTDLYKVPSTIISRCQCFDFHRISNSNIVKRLNFICEKENIKVDKKVLEQIAILSDGGLRDAIGMLDKLNSYSNSDITVEDFEKVNGIVSFQQQTEFLNFVYNKKITEIINFIDKIYDDGKNIGIFIENLLQLCKTKIISYYIDNENIYDIEFLLNFSKVLNELLKNNYSSNIRMLLEINLLSFLNLKNSGQKEKQMTENKEPAIEIENEIISREIISENNIDFQENNRIIVNNCFARASKKEKQKIIDNWNKLNDYALDNQYGAAACYISDGNVCAVGEGEIIICFDYESMVNRGLSMLSKIECLFDKIFNKHYDIAIITTEQWNKEKKIFIENKNNKKYYEYTPLQKISEKQEIKMSKNLSDNSITNEAIELFGEDIITVN